MPRFIRRAAVVAAVAIATRISSSPSSSWVAVAASSVDVAAEVTPHGETVLIQQQQDERLPTATAYLEIKPSTIAGGGLGVFLSPNSTTTIPAGTLVTRYAGRLMRKEDCKDYTYAMKAPKPGYVIVGEPWKGEVPYIVGESDSVGHLANDAAVIDVPFDPAKRVVESAELIDVVTKYYEAVGERGNVLVTYDESGGGGGGEEGGQGFLDMVASRDIQPGEELFNSYGHYYWMWRHVKTHPSPLTRLMVYMFLITDGVTKWEEEGGARTLGAGIPSFVVLDQGGRLIDSAHGREADERQCRKVWRDTLGLADKKASDEVMRWAGIDQPGMTYKERLLRLFEAVMEPDL